MFLYVVHTNFHGHRNKRYEREEEEEDEEEEEEEEVGIGGLGVTCSPRDPKFAVDINEFQF